MSISETIKENLAYSKELVESGIEPADLRVHQPSLEDAYLSLTRGEAGGDDEAGRGEGEA